MAAILGCVTLLMASGSYEAGSPKAPRVLTPRADEVVLWGPEEIIAFSTKNWVIYDFSFNADSIVGDRYRFVFGPTYCAVRAWADSQEWNAASPFDVGTTGYHSLSFWAKGTPGSTAEISVVRSNEPRFKFYGPQYFVRKTPIDTQTVSFSIPAAGESQYVLRVINGLPNGTNRMTSGWVKINGTQVLSTSDFGNGVAIITRDVSLQAQNTLVVYNQSSNAQSRIKIDVSAEDQTAPVVSLAWPPAETLYTEADTVHFAGTVTDETPSWARVNNRPVIQLVPGGTVPAVKSFSDSLTLTGQGRLAVSIPVINSARLSRTLNRSVIRDTEPPVLTIANPGVAPDSTASSSVLITGSWVDTTLTVVTIDGDVVGSGLSGTIAHEYPLDIGMNRIHFKAVDRLGHVTAFTRHMMRLTGTEHGAPTLNPSALSPATITPFYQSIEFLFTGSGAVQTGIVIDSLVPARVGVVRGHVVSRDYGPMANVSVSVLGHPEFGVTTTKNDGTFDLAVNGGRQHTLRFTKPHYLESQRKVTVPANDFAIVDDVALLGVTARFTAVNLDAPVVARSRFASDANGDRDMRLIFRPGTRAKVVKSSGDTATFSAIRVRATEYTVGGDGPESMPGELPPSSAYTYCVDLRTDQADSIAALVGKPHLSTFFTDTVSCYVRNFLHYPVGAYIPLGFYDSDSAKWLSESDGVVLEIIDTTGTGFRIDSNGDGLADGQARLDSLGITTNELTQLRTQFAVGDTLWRMRMTHFSRPDANVVLGGLLSALTNLGARAAKIALDLLAPCLGGGSIIECESRVLRERIPLAGTPYSLNYRSARARGDHALRSIHVPLFRNPPPPDLARVIVRLDVAGKRIERSISSPQQGDTINIGWDGNDAYGRPVLGSVVGRLGVGYQYRMFTLTGGGGNSWGNASAGAGQGQWGSGDRTDGMARFSYQQVVLGAADAGSAALGGWTISPHHFYDPKGSGTLYLGDGSVVSGESMPPTLTHLAGVGQSCGPGSIPCDVDNLPAISAPLRIGGMARGPDGSLYIAENGHGSIYRVDAQGILRRVAGTGKATPFVNGGPALNCGMRDFTDLAIGPDGTIYFTLANDNDHRDNNIVGRITPDGYVVKILGGNSGLDGVGDDGSVANATVRLPLSIALGPDGSLFVGDSYGSPWRSRVRRITPDGRILAYAGKQTGSLTTASSARALDLVLYASAYDLVVEADGTLHMNEGGQSLWRVTPDGSATRTIAVDGISSGQFPIALHPEGGLYVGDPHTSGRVFHLDKDSTLTSIAGGGIEPALNGMPASSVALSGPKHVIANQDGSYDLTLISATDRIHRIGRTLGIATQNEYAITDPSGSSIHYFSLNGQHQRTRDALSGAVLFSFRYDPAGRLAAIYDVNGDSTVIVRNGSSVPSTIVAPFGQTTTLGVTAGLLSSVSFNNEAYSLTTSTAPASHGLLTELVDPENHSHTYHYDATGRLDIDTDPEANSQTFPTPTIAGQKRTNDRFTAENRRTTYETTSGSDGTLRRKVTGPDGFQTMSVDSAVFKSFLWTPDRLTRVTTLAPDSRLGILGAFAKQSIGLLPSPALSRTVETSRQYNPPNFNPPTINGSWTEEMRVNGKPPARRVFVKTGGAVDSLYVVSPLGRLVTVALDLAGRPLTTLVPGLDVLELTRDARGRVTLSKQGNRIWRYGYDTRGRLSFVRDTLGRMTQLGYDDSDRLTSEVLPGGRTVGLGYDHRGNLTSVTPPGRPAHGYMYTKTELNRRYVPPALTGQDSVASRYEYNRDRQLTRISRPDGSVVSLKYNATRARLDSITVARGRSTLYYAGSTGQLDSLSSPDGVTLTYGYNGPLPKSEQWSGALPGGVTHSISREHDTFFRDALVTVSGTPSVAYGYDDDGLLTVAGALSIHRRTDNGAIDSTYAPAGGGAIHSSVDYSPHGEVANLRYRHSSQGVLFQQSLVRDVLGRIVQLNEVAFGTSRVWGYRYDQAGRLYGVTLSEIGSPVDTVARYLYDPNGNRTSFRGLTSTDTLSATYDDQDRMLRLGMVQYEYTASGELRRKIEGGNSTWYRYDALGNLTSVLIPGGDSVSYVVDGVNRRVGRKWNGQWTGGWLYQDALRPAAELDPAGAVLNRYIYGADGQTPSLLVRGSTTYRLIVDYLGTVRGVVDIASGSVAQRRDLDVWGAPRSTTGLPFQALGFAGGLTDPTTGLVRFGARDYDPVSGRWTLKDPIGLNAGRTNFYAYAGNLPADLTDPTGLIDVDCLQLALDALGIADPTGAADGLNATLYLARGRGFDAGISLLAVVPYVGDLGKSVRPAANGAGAVIEALAGLTTGRSSGVKVVESADELRGVFGRLSTGGKAVEGTTYPGRLVELPDGTTVGLREGSRSGGPTIDIRLPDGILRKVHVQP